MKPAIATVCLSGILSEKLAAIAAAGFKGVEIFENDLVSFNGSPADVRRIVADLGLETVAFQPFRDFEGMPDDRRARVLKRAERKFDTMAELGCSLLMVCSNVAPESIGGLDRAADDLYELGERAQKRGVKVAFEALAWGRHISDYRDAWEAVRRADHPSVGVTLDSFHTFARKTDLKAIRNIPKDRIFLVQMADAPNLDMDYLSWSRHYRNFPGQGDFPLADFMDALAATGYDGPLSLEIFNDQFRAGSARSVAVDGHRSLIYLLDSLHKRASAKALTLPSAKALTLPSAKAPAQKSAKAPSLLPPRARVLGIEFVEFAVDKTTAPPLEKLLSGLGFRKSDAHVSKSVARWTQGGISIVVNAETAGFAHSFNIAHGTGVCAIALKVADAAATLERGKQLLDVPFEQGVPPGELEIPAVRGLGGSIVYFTDDKGPLARWWEIDFKPLRDQPAPDAGLLAIDHISQSMHYEEVLTWLLYYTSLLDLGKTPAQDVLDPGGLVTSQVVRSEDGAVQLILNASQSARTQASRFLNEAFGSGVQHIAFTCTDIFAAAARFKCNGVKMLEIPVNYYDDLEAKTDLSPEQIERLKAHNVLYETDATGEFFQLYTQTFDERFFFEIVERRGGYKGFGATNAQIRLTAQARSARPAGVPWK